MQFPLMRNNILRDDLDAVIEHLRQEDPMLTNGPKVREFEAAWSDWLGVRYSVFVNSGSSANLLTIALLRLRYPQGGEILVPCLTWSSDISAVLHCGFTPVFVDIDPTTLAMDAQQAINQLNDNTRAVFLTHAQGFDGLTDELISECARRGIHLLEDVCESHGATHNGVKAGSIGWVSNFSFYYAHHMSTIEGGMICTNDEQAYRQLRMLRSHGMVREAGDAAEKAQWQREFPDLNPEFIFAYPAYNMRNTEIGAIIGLQQLQRLDRIVAKRTANLHHFLARLNPDRYQTEFKLAGSSNYAFNLILREADDRLVGRLMDKMTQHGIEYRRGSAGGGNQVRQPYVRAIVGAEAYKQFPVTDHIHFYGFYLGNFPDLSTDEIDTLCAVVNDL